MPPTERSTFSIQELAIRILFPMLIGGAVVYAMMYYLAGPGDDRPPIIVSDGSVVIEEAAGSSGSATPDQKGTLKEVTVQGDARKTWEHDHSADKPKRLHVLVEGANAAHAGNCPVMYFAQNITTATIMYDAIGGPRDVMVTKKAGNNPVQISVRQDADVTQPSPDALTVDDGIGAQLTSVALVWGSGSSATTVTCHFGGALSPRIVILQTTK